MSPETPTQSIAKICQLCSEPFIATGRQAKTRLYCSPLCKRAAAGQRAANQLTSGSASSNSSASAPTAPTPGPAAPVPLTAAQRDCPHCGGPVTIVALLTTPEAARPSMPIAAPDGVIPLRRP
jgi:hypothetical protein